MVTINEIFKIKKNPVYGVYRTIQYNWKFIEKIPEFAKLEKCEQNPKWHSEGDAFTHTKLVCEHAIKYVNNKLIEEVPEHSTYNVAYDPKEYETYYLNPSIFHEALILLTAALFHDIGKGVTTAKGKDGNWHSYGHEYEGEKLTRYLLWNEEVSFREDVCSLVKYHMDPLNLYNRKDYIEQMIKMAYNIPSWKLLLALKRCDLEGSMQKDEELKERDRRVLNELESISKQIGYYKHVPCYVPNVFYDRIRGSEYYLQKSQKKQIDLILMIGIPGAGKDTFINKKLIIENKDTEKSFLLNDISRITNGWNSLLCIKKKDAVVLSRDVIRVELGFCKEGEKVVCSRKQEEEVNKEFKRQLFEAASEGKTIIINNTNLKKEYREEIARLLSNYLLNITYIYVEAGKFEDNVKRREGEISEKVMEDIVKKFEWPDFYEYDNFYYVRT